MANVEQEIRFCLTPDRVQIAYATVGEGFPLVKAANFLSHMEFDWRSPVWSHWLAELARDHLLVRYDERGCGLSDWAVEDFSFDAWVRDLESVVDALGLDQFVLLGISQGGPVAIEYAARHPDRVRQLILYGAYARGWAKRGSVEPKMEEQRALITLMREGWGRDNPAYRQIFTSLFIPEATLEQMRWFNELQRMSTSPENAVRFSEAFGEIDVQDRLRQLAVPTLVLHARRDAVVPFDEGRLLAASIPGTRFVSLESGNHILLSDEPAWETFLSEVRGFLGVRRGRVRRAPGAVTSRIAPERPPDDLAAKEAHALISQMAELALSRFSVVGNYMKYDERVRNRLKDARLKVVAAFETPGRARENHLLWAFPGSGKTYLIRQIARSLPDVKYVELNLAGSSEVEFASRLADMEKDEGPLLCLIDEIDAKANRDWPYETLLPHLDANAEGVGQYVFVMAGSSGSSMAEMKERIAARPKGADLLNRVPRGNEYEIQPISLGDRLLVATSHFSQAGREVDRVIKAVEKLALYYVALIPSLANPRQVREFAVRAVERLPSGEDRIKYDHLFNPGDPENKAFWVQASPVVEDLTDRFVTLRD
jgi:pimeloyl-ACP methyl ester carboxylesterase